MYRRCNMAYINEFPNWDSNKLNLDWILEQYSTFNQRIQEIQDHFDEVAEAMGEEVAQLESDFDDFKTLVNNNMDSFETEIQHELSSGLATIQQQVTFISSNMADYISEHMNEWQAQAAYSDAQKRVNFNTSNNPLLDQNKSVYSTLIGNVIHETRLNPPLYFVEETNPTITNNYIDDCNITLTPGTFLVMAKVDFVATMITDGKIPVWLSPNDSDVIELIGGYGIDFISEGTNIPGQITVVGLYTNTNTTTNKTVKIGIGGATRTVNGVRACAYKLSDIWNPIGD